MSADNGVAPPFFSNPSPGRALGAEDRVTAFFFFPFSAIPLSVIAKAREPVTDGDCEKASINAGWSNWQAR